MEFIRPVYQNTGGYLEVYPVTGNMDTFQITLHIYTEALQLTEILLLYSNLMVTVLLISLH